jgi:hypothetical protein
MPDQYAIDNLGWKRFERLIQALLKQELDATVQAWGGTADEGKDATYADTLRLRTGRELPGPVLFQCKFIYNANAPGAKIADSVRHSVNSEILRIQKRSQKDSYVPPRTYIFITNAKFNPALREFIPLRLKTILPDSVIESWDNNDVQGMLDAHPLIRQSYPELLSIADLDFLLNQNINKEVIIRSRFALEQAKVINEIFVSTNAYIEAVKSLDTNYFLVLTGAPEMGKTTIARMIALARHTLGWEIIECYKPDIFFSQHRPGTQQLFIADDAFGSTEYSPTRSAEWERDMDSILPNLSKERHFIWTSRPVPLHEALTKLSVHFDGGKFPDPSKIVVDASKLTRTEKALILYSHAKRANLPDDWKRVLRVYGKQLVGNRHFTPLRIELFVTQRLRHMMELLNKTPGHERSIVTEFMNAAMRDYTDYMLNSYKALSDEQRILLLSTLDLNDGAMDISGAKKQYLKYAGQDAKPFEEVLGEIEGHFIRVRE